LTKEPALLHKNKNNHSHTLHKEPEPVIDDDEVSAKIATNRPRLVRQSAFFSDEVVIEPEVCPVHGSLIPGTYDDENEDEEERCGVISDLEEEDEEDLEDPASPILRKYSVMGSSSNPTSSIPNSSGHNRDIGNPYSIALVILPRRLSTISSRDTTSIQSREEAVGGGGTEVSIITPSSSGGRRKMSEPPVHLQILSPAASGNGKRHSMSSVELMGSPTVEGSGNEVPGAESNEADGNRAQEEPTPPSPNQESQKLETLA
jgi:hypothetical protein